MIRTGFDLIMASLKHTKGISGHRVEANMWHKVHRTLPAEAWATVKAKARELDDPKELAYYVGLAMAAEKHAVEVFLVYRDNRPFTYRHTRRGAEDSVARQERAGFSGVWFEPSTLSRIRDLK